MTVYFDPYLKAYNRLYLDFEQIYHNVALRAGLSDCGFFILYTLCEIGDGCRPSDLYALIPISKQTVHSALHKLEKEGVLALTAGSGRRAVQISLTETGHELVARAILPVIHRENAALAELTAAERHELLRLMEKYLSAIKRHMDIDSQG